jgi:hypothetical protein
MALAVNVPNGTIRPVSAQEAALNTALVVTAAQGGDARDSRSVPRGSGRPRADFIAQLIATRIAAPQTRTRRRAEPDEAIAAYAALDQMPKPSGRALSRAL